MADQVLKNREDQVEDSGGGSDLDAQDASRDNEPQVDVQKRGDEHVISGPVETRRERRERELRERTAQVFDERSRPMMDGLNELRATMGQLAAAIAQGNRPVQQERTRPKDDSDAPDPEWMDIGKRQGQLQRLMSNASESELPRLQEEWFNLDFKRQRIVARKEAESVRERLSRELPQQQEPYVLQVLKGEFPDVFQAGPAAMQMTQAHFILEEQAARASGKPYNELDVHRKALNRTAEAMRLRQPQSAPADPVQRARFSGVAQSSTGNSGGDARALSHEEKKMARAFASTMAPGATDDEAFRMWTAAMVRQDPNFFKR